MVCRVLMAWTFRACAVLGLTLACASLHAQRFVDRSFRAYPVRTAPDTVEQSLHRFFAERIRAGEDIEIVSDPRGHRVLVRGSDEVHQLAAQFVQAMDGQPVTLPPQRSAPPPAQRPVRAYAVRSAEELPDRLTQLRQRFANRTDVRIASDERTGQIFVEASDDVHQEIIASWTPVGPLANQHGTSDTGGPATDLRLPLRNISWQDLLRGLRGLQGRSVAVSAPADNSQLELTLASATGDATRLQIDERNSVVQLTGTSESTQKWAKVVQALDSEPVKPGEATSAGALGDAQPATITRTIGMLGGYRAGGPAAGPTQWGGDVVSRMFGQRAPREPLRLAQAGALTAQQPDEAGDQAELADDEAMGSFLGPVQIQFLEGTDIFIVRGQRRDVERVMEIIRQIEEQSELSQPAIEIVHLTYTNSQALATLIQQLFTGPLAARQGDISVTALVKPNALLLIGREAGVEATKKLIERLDVPLEPSAQFRVFQLNHVPSVDLERTLNVLFPPEAAGVQAADAETQGLAPRIRVVADFRTNALVVYGSPRDLEEIGDLISQIDVPSSGIVNEVRVFQLKNSLATEVEEVLTLTLRPDDQQQGGFGAGAQGGFGGQAGAGVTLPRSSPRATMLQMKILDAEQKELLASGILSDVTVAANERANSIVVVAPKDSMPLIAELIRQLDDIASNEAEIVVITIKNGDAESLIEMLNTLFERDLQDEGPAIQTAAGSGESSLVPLRFALDLRTNSIIASGNENDLLVVEAILLKLEAEDVSARRTSVYELLNAPADAVATAITQFLTTERDVLIQDGGVALTPFEQIEREVVVVPEINSNKLIISATDRYFEQIMQLIRDLDKRSDMVLIQVLIAEVGLFNAEEMGVELGIQDSLLFDRSAIAGIIPDSLFPGFNFNTTQSLGNSASAESLATREKAAGQAISNFALGRQDSELGFGGLVLSASSESVSVLIRALQAARRIDILSRPQIMTLNNQEAFVQVGETVPYITASNVTAGVVSNSVTFRDVGFILRVVPRISPDGLVVMDILADKSQLGPLDEGIVIGSSDGVPLRAPIIETQRAQTVVSARDGQTVILGGLIDTTRETVERKVPYLGDLPFFGRLFRVDSLEEERSELLIIMTPKIIRGQEDLDVVNSEEHSRMSWCLSDVVEMFGDLGPSGIHHSRVEGEVIYPDLDASESDSGTQGSNGRRMQYEAPAPTTLGPSAALPQWNPVPEQTRLHPPTPIAPVDTRPNTSWSQANTDEPTYNIASPAARPIAFQHDPNRPPPPSSRAVYRFDEVPER